MAVRNIKDLQIGEGTLYLNNRDVGALTDARFTAEIEKVVHQSGMPLKINKVAITSQRSLIAANLNEINPSNLALALGVKDSDVASTTGETKEVTNEILTISGTNWVALQNGSLDETTPPTVKLATLLTQVTESTDTKIYVEDASEFTAGDGVTIGGVNKTIQSITGNEITLTAAVGVSANIGDPVINTTVAYVENTDYQIDYIDGRVRKLSGGDIPESGYLAVTYKYQLPSSVQVPLGAVSSLPVVVAEFVVPRDDGEMRIHLYRAQVSGNLEFAFNATDWHSIPVEIEGLGDPAHNGESGYVRFVYTV